MYLKIQIRRSLIHGKLENWDWTLRRTHSFEDQKHIEPRVQLFVQKKKKHSLFNWNVLMSQDQLVQIWTLHKKNELMIIGTSMKTEVCQIRGQVSRNSLYWKRHLQKDICGPGGDWQTFKRLLVQIIFGLKLGQDLEKPLNEKKNKNGHSKKQNLRMPGVWEEFIMLIQVMKHFVTSSRMQETPMTSALPCKRTLVQTSNRVAVALKKWRSRGIWNKDKIQLHCRSTWIYETQNWISHKKESWRPHCRERTTCSIALQLSAEIYSDAPSNENSGCEGCSG